MFFVYLCTLILLLAGIMEISLSGHYGYKRILKSVLPSIGMVLITSIYSIVDGFFVSNYAGKSGFAAVNLMFPAMMMLGSLGLMVGSGGGALIAKVKGEGYLGKANRIFSMLVHFSLQLGIVMGVLFAIFAPSIAEWLGADEGMMQECVTYGRLCMIGMPGFVLQMAFQSFYMAAERPQLGTLMSVVSGVINILLDALLVWGFHLGVAGAAVATAVAQLVGGLFPLVYFGSRRLNKGSLTLLLRVRFVLPYIGKACSNGLSEYVGNIAMNIVSICYNLQLMRYLGEDGVAAYGVVMYLAFVYAAIFIGYNIAITPIIGYHYGARNLGKQRSLFRKSLVIIGLTGMTMTLMAEVMSGTVSHLFVGYDADLMALTTKALRLYMLCFLICGWSMFVSALFTALQNGLVSAVAAFARSLVFELSCVWLLPALVGIDGIWWAVNMAEMLTLILCFFLVKKYAPQMLSRVGR